MNRIELDELLEQFDEIMERVENGEKFLILDNEVEKAVLLPYEEYQDMKETVSIFEGPCD